MDTEESVGHVQNLPRKQVVIRICEIVKFSDTAVYWRVIFLYMSWKMNGLGTLFSTVKFPDTGVRLLPPLSWSEKVRTMSQQDEALLLTAASEQYAATNAGILARQTAAGLL